MPDHAACLATMRVLPTDYTDYGGKVERWSKDDNDADCSWGCRHAAWLKGELGGDWCVCTKLGSPRAGLLTFEHQAGRGCFEPKGRRKDSDG